METQAVQLLELVLILIRVATKIFEGFGKALFKEFIMSREPVSIVHYTKPGTLGLDPVSSGPPKN